MNSNLFKMFLFILLLSAAMAAVGYITISIAEQKFKGAICHSIDEKECEYRYNVYKYCVEAIKNHEDINQDLGRELCFKTAFFDKNLDQ